MPRGRPRKQPEPEQAWGQYDERQVLQQLAAEEEAQLNAQIWYDQQRAAEREAAGLGDAGGAAMPQWDGEEENAAAAAQPALGAQNFGNLALPTFREEDVPQPNEQEHEKLDLGEEFLWPYKYPEIERVRNLWELQVKPTMYPDKGLYPIYFDWAQKSTDVPLSNHWACLTTGLSACLGRWHRIEDGGRGVVPCVFSLILAKSGQRKSFGMKILKEILPADIRDTQFPRSDVALLQLLKKQPWRLWTLDEASKFFKMLANQYQTQAIENLVQVYDGETISVYTQTAGTLRSPPSYLCLLAASTLAAMLESKNLSEAQLHELIHGGLFGRFFICPATNAADEGGSTMFEPQPRDERIRVFLKGWLTRLYAVGRWRGNPDEGDDHIVYKLSDEARLELHRWIAQTGAGGVLNKIPHEGLASFWNRAPLQAKRLALLYHISKADAQLGDPISVDSMVRAINFVHYYLAPAFLWFVQYATRTGFAQITQRVQDELQRANYGVRYRDICELAGITIRQRAEALAILDSKIHYEKWQDIDYDKEGNVVAQPGKPHVVVVWGKDVAEQKLDKEGNNLRYKERRLKYGRNIEPPPHVQQLIKEKRDAAIDSEELEGTKDE